jgi:chromatin remodeling complex protein RSC6
MPKQTKSESAPKQTKTEKVAPEAKPAKASAEAKPAKVSAEVKPAKVSKKKEVAASVPAVAESVVAESAVVESAAVVESVATVSTDFADFMVHLQQLSTVISSLKTEFRNLEKKATRELKTAAKVSNKRKRKTGNRSPSGFVKPTLISDELATFLGKTTGTQMARTEVTREINAYIREHKLQDKTNGRRINADTKLSSLLKLTSGEELTYFNLQRYMSPHFAKSVAVAPVTV